MTENKYIKIVEMPQKTGAKTKWFYVYNKCGNYNIAKISWYSQWRQYCIFPSPSTVFNSECLELITNFLKDINVKHFRYLKKIGDKEGGKE